MLDALMRLAVFYFLNSLWIGVGVVGVVCGLLRVLPELRADARYRICHWDGWPLVLFGCWFIGMCLMVGHVAWSFLNLRYIKRGGRLVEVRFQGALGRLVRRSRIRRWVQVRRTGAVTLPVAVGLFRPAILIPERLIHRLSEEEMEQVVMPEMAHLYRYDDRDKVLHALVEAILFFDPVVWWVGHRMDQERELDCDDRVVAATGAPQQYAGCLTRVTLLGNRRVAMAAAMGGRQKHIFRRIERLMNRTPRTFGMVSRMGLWVISVALILLAVQVVRMAPVFEVPGRVEAYERLARWSEPLARVVIGSPLPNGIGLSKQVVVMIDPSDVSTLAESLKHLLGKKTYTPQPEVLFEVEYVLPGSSDAVVRRKNLILTGAIDGESPGGQLVRNVLDAEEQEKVRLGEIGVVIKHDVWAKDQLVVIVSGQDKEDVKDWMQLEHDRIYRALEGSLDAWLAGLLYRKGENQALTDTLFRRFGWQVQVPSEFRMLDENADQNFVVFSRAISGRRVWVSVYWENGVSPDVLTAEWCLEKRDEISRRFLGEDRVIPEGAEAYEVELGGKLAVCLEGLWENTQSWHGGPFRSYALVDVDQERLYFLDAGVFAPNKTKALHLRQLDGLVRTFRVDPFFKKKWIDSGPTTREKVRR